MKPLNLLPYPRSVRRQAGVFELPTNAALYLEPDLPRDSTMLPLAGRLREAAAGAGVNLELITGPAQHPRLAIKAVRSASAPDQPEGYSLTINSRGVAIEYQAEGGLRAAVATLRQLLREYGRRLPRLMIRDWPDFPRRGVMLDISRGRVPKLATLIDLVEKLADFKINEFQVYIEHTFAYRNFESIWRDWGALTGEEMLQLDARCRELGIDFVPNQNSFGHLRYWLEHASLRKLAEIDQPYESPDGTFLRYPTTLAPEHPGTLPFLRGLYDELLPHFTSGHFNVGCDETWDLGRGRSKAACEKRGKGRVYLDFLLKIHREVKRRGRRMMFWGDIILHHPELIKRLPDDVLALNWGYDFDHPFEKEAPKFANAGVPFYVCPGTSTWMSLIGKHDNAFPNLQRAAKVGAKHGARGYLNTDWGDGGHPQPLAVSWLPFILGAAVSWCADSCDESLLVPVANRDVFHDPAGNTGPAALGLGHAHRKFGYSEPNVTPYGAVIAAPPAKWRELFCRSGLKYYARIPEKKIRSALDEVEKQRAVLYRGRPATPEGEMLAAELDMAARMAEQSCHYLLWQQCVAAKQSTAARTLAKKAVRDLRELDADFEAYWPWRNKGTTAKCSAFLKWRIDDYRKERLHYSPEQAKGAPSGAH